MEGWKGGKLEWWKDGKVEGWKDGKVEGWKSGRVKRQGEIKPMARRTCRVCGLDYEYPVPASTATRFLCEECVTVPPNVRRVLEMMHRDIKRLQTRVTELEQKISSAKPAGGDTHM